MVRQAGGKNRIEYPLGTVIYQTSGTIQRMVLELGPASTILVMDLEGKNRKTLLSDSQLQDLAWSPKGAELWFESTAIGNAAGARALLTREKR